MSLAAQNERFLAGLKKAAAYESNEKHAEQSLMELAYAVLVEKARPLMKDPFRLGFEVVYTNEDHSRMVGIFVFRVGKDLFYIPAFYRNGQVRGMHTIFSCKSKQIKPLTADWASRLVAKATHQTGREEDKEVANNYSGRINMRNVTGVSYNHPTAQQGTIKVASAKELLGEEGIDLQAIFGAIPEGPEPGALLRTVIAGVGPDILPHIKHACAQSPAFADAFMTTLPDWEEVIAVAAQKEPKQASTSHDNRFLEVIPAGHEEFNTRLAELDSATQMRVNKDGYMVVEGGLEKAASLATVQDFESISCPGVYDVDMTGGDREKFLILCAHEAYGADDSGSVCNSGWTSTKAPYGRAPGADETNALQSTPCMAVSCKDNKFAGELPDHIYGDPVQDPEETVDKYCDDAPRPDKVYLVVDKVGKKALCRICVSKVRKERSGENELYYIYGNNVFPYTDIADYPTAYGSRENLLAIYNPNSCSDLDKKRYGKEIGFIPLKTTSISENSLGYKEYRIETVQKEMFADTLNKPEESEQSGTVAYVNVAKDKLDKKYTVRVKFDANGDTPMYKKATFESALPAALCLASWTGLAFRDAMEATHNNDNKYLVKNASLLQAPPLPQWLESHNTDHGVNMQEIEKYVLQVPSPNYKSVDDLTSNLGDRIGLDEPPNLLVATPSELFQYSEANDVKTLFEHGAVKEIIKTYDVGMMINNFLPDLESALDRMGRILILIHWKPSEVAELYGVDDTMTLEDNILNGFLNLGEIVLDLDVKVRGLDER